MAEVKTTEGEEQQQQTLLLTCSPTSAGDPPFAADKSDENDAENCRQTKRRKSCPSALEKSFSFSFDTNSQANTLQFTPKFGSFKLTEPPPPPPDNPASKKREDEGLSSADHVISNGD